MELFFEGLVAVFVIAASYCLGYGVAYLKYRAPFETFQKNVKMFKKIMIREDRDEKEKQPTPKRKAVRLGNNVFYCEVSHGERKEGRSAN